MLICIFIKELKEKYLMGTWDVYLKKIGIIMNEIIKKKIV